MFYFYTDTAYQQSALLFFRLMEFSKVLLFPCKGLIMGKQLAMYQWSATRACTHRSVRRS